MENAKRLTVALDDETYVKLIDYAASMSKQRRGRFSLSEALRELVSRGLYVDDLASKRQPVGGGRDRNGQ
jgi:hypothetical protein